MAGGKRTAELDPTKEVTRHHRTATGTPPDKPRDAQESEVAKVVMIRVRQGERHRSQGGACQRPPARFVELAFLPPVRTGVGKGGCVGQRGGGWFVSRKMASESSERDENKLKQVSTR